MLSGTEQDGMGFHHTIPTQDSINSKLTKYLLLNFPLNIFGPL